MAVEEIKVALDASISLSKDVRLLRERQTCYEDDEGEFGYK